MRPFRIIRRLSLTIVVCCIASQALAQVSIPDAELLPNTPGTDAEKSVPFLTKGDSLAPRGYIETEHLVSGVANIYDYVDDASQSPLVQVVEAGLPYTTRILVRRPRKRSKFNGTVYLDILNATRGYDGEITWQYSANMIMDEGAVYVGITSASDTVNFLRDEFGKPPFKPRNASRYATLSMPNDGQIWDMLSQTAALLKAGSESVNPLAGFNVQRVILTGHSQSAGFIKTYLNSFHSDAILTDGRQAIDGYFEAAGSFAGKRPNPFSGAGEFNGFGDPRNKSVKPVPAPVFRFQTETEVNSFFVSQLTRQTEADSPMVRTYEMAGGAHVDSRALAMETQQNFDELGLGPGVSCEIGPSTLPVEYVFSALLVRMDRWIRKGSSPPPSRLISLVENESGQVSIEKNADGNTVGGIHLPQLDVPTGIWAGGNPDLFCFLSGSYSPYSRSELRRRYPRHSDYILRTRSRALAAYLEGFLLPRSAWEIIREAARSDIGGRDRRDRRRFTR